MLTQAYDGNKYGEMIWNLKNKRKKRITDLWAPFLRQFLFLTLVLLAFRRIRMGLRAFYCWRFCPFVFFFSICWKNDKGDFFRSQPQLVFDAPFDFWIGLFHISFSNRIIILCWRSGIRHMHNNCWANDTNWWKKGNFNNVIIIISSAYCCWICAVPYSPLHLILVDINVYIIYNKHFALFCCWVVIRIGVYCMNVAQFWHFSLLRNEQPQPCQRAGVNPRWNFIYDVYHQKVNNKFVSCVCMRTVLLSFQNAQSHYTECFLWLFFIKIFVYFTATATKTFFRSEQNGATCNNDYALINAFL